MGIEKKLIGNEEERAVSPVIGVILMVAITVILAAVIAAFVLDLGQSQSTSASAGVSFSESGDLVSVQVVDEGNTDSIYVQLDNESSSTTQYVNPSTPEVGDSSAKVSWGVGNTVEFNASELGNGDDVDSNAGTLSGDVVDRITVLGEVDGEEQVIQTWERS